MSELYLIALGSNVAVPAIGQPASVLRAALAVLDGDLIAVRGSSPIIDSAPIGPSLRRYANSAALVETALSPDELLAHLQAIEFAFGRTRAQRRGQRWRARVLDLDIILWSEGLYHSKMLTIPHPQFRARAFVLGPAAKLAPDWRDPLTGRSIAQLAAQLARPSVKQERRPCW